ncbi:translation initiation factor IF-2-like [Equus quagga]|uniref:translation initiation factor IF-2-like n=1 Tax=Equus quagga TaxID=89248 RepID=UPI001EE280E6|nr:translation initiation factor IF-2-like [Equus quagga]
MTRKSQKTGFCLRIFTPADGLSTPRGKGCTQAPSQRSAAASPRPRRNYPGAPPAPQLRPAPAGRRGHTLSPLGPRPAARAAGRRPAPPVTAQPCPATRLQFSNLNCKLRLPSALPSPRATSQGVRSPLLAVVRKSKSGSCHARSSPAPPRAGAGERVPGRQRRGAGREPPGGAAPREPAAARAVSVCRRASAGLPRLAGGLGLRLRTPEPAPFPLGAETPECGRGPEEGSGGVGGSRVPWDPRAGGDGLGLCRPSNGRMLRPPSRIAAGVLLPWFPRVQRGGRPVVLPTPLSARRACLCVSECLCVCALSPGRPGLSPARVPPGPPRDRLPRVPCTSRRRGRSCPSRVHSCGVGTGRVHIWTRGRVLLTLLLGSEVCAHPLGHFQLLLVNSFSMFASVVPVMC